MHSYLAMELWTGLAALKADPKCRNLRRFGEGKGAYVHIVAWGQIARKIRGKGKARTQDLDCILCKLGEVGLLEEKMKATEFPEEFIDMRATAYRQMKDIGFGPFYTWLQDDAN